MKIIEGTNFDLKGAAPMVISFVVEFIRTFFLSGNFLVEFIRTFFIRSANFGGGGNFAIVKTELY